MKFASNKDFITGWVLWARTGEDFGDAQKYKII